jgi:hypothetical protein
VFAVINSQEGAHTLYKLTAMHSQNNHQLLQEGTPLIDTVDMHRYKYYKFTLPDEEGASSTILNVTFEISPLHGDCDLYASH